MRFISKVRVWTAWFLVVLLLAPLKELSAQQDKVAAFKQAVALVHQYVPPDAQRIQATQEGGNLSLSPVGPETVRLDFRNFVKGSDQFILTINSKSNSIQAINVKSYLDTQKDAVSLEVAFAFLNTGVNYPVKTVLVAPEKNIQVVIQNSDYQLLPSAAQPPPQQPNAMAGAPPQGQQAQSISPQQVDSLTAPIALYPDALIAQILTASTNFFQLQSFAGWLGKNASLHGSALQDAAQNAGYDACFVALAPFSQVVQMMVQKPDSTKQLGQIFTADRSAVFDSIQRLRAQAQAVGNLKSTPQQEVQTQTISSGQQVIVIQPANPQVIYVPQYNPQVVYVQSAPPPSSTSSSAAGAALIGFTAGIIIGASASNNYYHGPYAWRGASMYNQAWNNQSYYANQRQNTYNQNSAQRQNTYDQNSSQRQSTSQSNQQQRQSTSQSNQTNRQAQQGQAQSNAQANQSTRQSSASGAQSNAQTNQSTRQSSASGAQSNAQTSQATRQSGASSTSQANQSQRQSSASTSTRGSGQTSAQTSGTRSSGASGYQSGSKTQSQSARGNSSMSSSGRKPR